MFKLCYKTALLYTEKIYHSFCKKIVNGKENDMSWCFEAVVEKLTCRGGGPRAQTYIFPLRAVHTPTTGQLHRRSTPPHVNTSQE